MRKLSTLMIVLFLWAMGSWAQNSAVPVTNSKPRTAPAISQMKNHPSSSKEQSLLNTNPTVLPQNNDAPAGFTVTPYHFLQTSGTYTAITGGATMGTTTDDDVVYGPFNIGFTFTYAGSTFTQFCVSTNGFISLGATLPATNNYLPVSGAANYTLAPVGLNLAQQTGSELRYQTIGSGSAQTLVVQFKNFRYTAATGENYNFQVRLNQSDNSIKFVYGAFTVVANRTPQVGIRGSASTEWSNRLINASWLWATSTYGIVNTSNCFLRAATIPATGQTYTWTPYAVYNCPFSENFDASPTDPIAANWSQSNNNSDAYQWSKYNYPGANSLPDCMGVRYPASGSNNDWLYTPAFNITSGKTYKVGFYYAGYDATGTERLTIKYGAQPSAAGMTSAAIYTNTAITNTAFAQGQATFVAATTGVIYVGFQCTSTSTLGYYLFLDDISVDEMLAHDAGGIALINPTKIPTGQQLPWFGKSRNLGLNTESFPVVTTLRENGSAVTNTTNNLTSITSGTTTTHSGAFDLSTYGAGSTYDMSIKTNLTGDLNTANDEFTNYIKPCTIGDLYAWDDGVSEGSVGFDTGSGWMGQLYTFSSATTLYGCQVQWGTIVGNLTNNSLEIYNVSGGVPTTKFADITTGINISPTDAEQWRSYDAASAVALPAGTYWIGIHQSVAMAGTFMVSDDQTGFNSTKYFTGKCFYSGDATTWTDYNTSGLFMFNMIRPDFKVVLCVNPSNFTGAAASTSQINLSWNLNVSGNNVLVAWSNNGVFGTPVDGHVYSATNLITGGGTVLQYNNATSYNHTSLNPGDRYYYKIWSYNGTNYSSGVTGSYLVPCDPTVAPITETFESGVFPPYCWPELNGSMWADNTDASAYGVGLHSALAAFYDISAGVTFDLITLPFDASGMASPSLAFDWAYATYTDGAADQMDIYTSTNNGSTWTLLLSMPGGTAGILNPYAISTASSFVPTAAQWSTKILSIGNTVNKVKFTATSAYGNNLYLDNVKVYQVYAHDVGIQMLDPIRCFPVGTVSPKATVVNNGTSTETNFNVTMTIGTYNSTKTIASLASGANTVVTFDPWTTSAGNYTMQACTSLAGDLNSTNDCLSQSVKVMVLNKQVYGYTTFTTTDNGPITFNLNSPGTITELVNEYPVTTYPGGGSWANGKWYASIYSTVTPYNLVTFDPVTGARVVVGDMGVNINAMSYNKANSTMYGAGFDGTNSILYTISLTTGTATLVGTIGTQLIINMAIDNSGACYATDLTTDILGTINLTTAAFTPIGSIGFNANYAQDMEFDRETGELYMAAYGSTGQLRWVDKTTGNSLVIGDFQGGVEVTGFAIPYTSVQEFYTATGTVTGSQCYNATNTVTVGSTGTPFLETGTGYVTVYAGTMIHIVPNATVQAGGYMLCRIQGLYCPTANAPMVAAETTGQDKISGLEQANFTIYPNPTSGNFTIVQKGDKLYSSVKLEVYSMRGDKVMNESMIGTKKHDFRFAEMPNGIYFVKVIADDYVETIKLVKTR